MSKSSYKELNEAPAYRAPEYGDKGQIVNADKNSGVPIWANAAPPPAIGAVVKVTMNGLGNATVVRYFVESGFLGLLVKFADPPEWYLKQNKGNPPGHIFGPEFKAL